MEVPPLEHFAVPLALVAAGVLAGVLVERIVLHWLGRPAEATKWPNDNVVVAALKGIPLFWGAVAGLYLATLAASPPPSVLVVLENVVAVLVLWSLVVVGARVASGLVTAYAGREGTFIPATSLIPTLVRLGIYVVGVLLVLNELDISVTPLLTALGVGGLAVALALQDTLSNVFAGLYLIASGQIRPGDYVRMESDEEGTVADINWRSTTLRTMLGNTVVVPNATLAGATVTNYSFPERPLYVRVTVGVDYDADIEHVERVSLEVAEAVLRDFTRGEPEPPRLYFHTFGEFSLNFTLVLRIRDVLDQFELRHRLIKALLARYRAEGIRFPFPIREFEMQLSTEGLEADEASTITPAEGGIPAVDHGPVRREAGSGGPERFD
jgi:small-conductance mechanosensitive channel